MKNKVVAIILARGGSKGIKKKNLIKINNKPLIFWSIKSCLLSKSINDVWVSSDSKEILKISKKYGAKVIQRPKKYAGDNSSSESAWIHAIQSIKYKDKIKTIIGVQPTSPLRPDRCFDDALRIFNRGGYDSLFTFQKISDYFIWNTKNKKLVANYNFKKRPLRQQIITKKLENGSFYIFDKTKFLKNKCRLFGKIGCYEMSKIFSFQIDENEDIRIFQNFKKFFI